MIVVFFFKQKTAYEIGLGIPAEPLFRSSRLLLLNTKDQVYAQNEMLAYQQKESTARVASIMEKIGRASCRERVKIADGAEVLKKKTEADERKNMSKRTHTKKRHSEQERK